MNLLAQRQSDAISPHETIPLLNCSAALTHHWLVRPRGGEKVLAALQQLVPPSPLYTLIYDPAGFAPGTWTNVYTSPLQRIPGARRHYPKLLPLHPWAFRAVKLPEVDLVLCSDAALAKAMTPHPHSQVVCYCHSPMRYVWETEICDEYRRSLPRLARPLFNHTIRRLARADAHAAKRVDQFVANSQHVAERIRRHYNRDAVVIHPPVDLPSQPTEQPREDFFLCVGYHVPYKRLDLAVNACRTLKRKLIVIGEGPAIPPLRQANDPYVHFLGWQPTNVIHDHYRRASALLFPGEEDFGIVPVEAIAHGCPVIALGVGGATETVTPNHTGIWFEPPTVDALIDAIQRCRRQEFDPAQMHADAQRFSTTRFLHEMRNLCENAMQEAAPPS